MVFAQKKLISPRARLRRAGRVFAAIGEILLVANFLYFVATWVTMQSGAQITDIVITAGNAIDKDAVRTIVEEELSQRILWRIQRNNIALYPAGEMVKRIESLDKRILAVSVDTKGLHQLIVSVNEHQPAKLWCREKQVERPDIEAATTTDQCFYANTAGYIFAESPQYLGTTFMVYRTMLPGTTTPIGTYMLRADHHARIESLMTALLAMGVSISTVREETGGDYLLETNFPWSIKWSIAEDPKKSAENLSLVIDAINKDKDHPEPPTVIDLRFGNKVFYK